MLTFRTIPCLLLNGQGLVKTVKFRNPYYVGDPTNAIKIFNEKEVDELIFLDIKASRTGEKPPLHMIKRIASECFMPVCFGGGIKNVAEMAEIFNAGIEKVSISSAAVANPALITAAAKEFGSQSIVVTVDYKKNLFGKSMVYTHGGTRKTNMTPLQFARMAEDLGAGEILLNSIDRDGTMKGYDLATIKAVSDSLEIPLIACGGAGSLTHLQEGVFQGGASAAAAGSLFVFHGRHRAVLINYPERSILEGLFEDV